MDKGALLKRTCWVLEKDKQYSVFTSLEDMRAYMKDQLIDREINLTDACKSVFFTGLFIGRADLYERIEENE